MNIIIFYLKYLKYVIKYFNFFYYLQILINIKNIYEYQYNKYSYKYKNGINIYPIKYEKITIFVDIPHLTSHPDMKL